MWYKFGSTGPFRGDRMRHRFTFGGRGITLGLVATVAGLCCFAAVTAAAPMKMVVLLKRGASVKTATATLKASPSFTYAAPLPGFAAVLDDAAQQRLRHDPNVLMAAQDRRFRETGTRALSRTGPLAKASEYGEGQELFAGCTTAANGRCLASDIPQFVPTDLERIGLLQSPTAAVDGTEQPIPVGVAVLDTGIETENPELDVVGGVNCSDSPQPGYGDVEGHGTEVAGVIGAKDNSVGVVGVAPGVPLYSVRVLDEEGEGEGSNIVCGIDWVLAHHEEIRVANMSLAGFAEGPADDHHCGLANEDPEHYAICQAVKAGVTFVAAAGNEASDAAEYAPAGYRQVITAAGLSETDQKPGGDGEAKCLEGRGFGADNSFAYFSNHGPSVDIIAVATCVITDSLEGTLIEDDGTSFSAPAVAGAAALLIDKDPSLTPAQVEQQLKRSAERDGRLPGRPPKTTNRILDVAGF